MIRVGGIDPGPRPGLVILHVHDEKIVRVERGAHLSWRAVVAGSDYVAVESYVRGARSSRMGAPAAQLATEAMAKQACSAASAAGRVLQSLPAGAVKPWADDERLRSYLLANGPGTDDGPSLYELTRGGGGHDRDAARHALRLAVGVRLLPKR